MIFVRTHTGQGGAKVLAFLRVRKEACCSRSKKEFKEDDKLVRLVKCRHWYIEEQLKEMVWEAMKINDAEQQGPPYSRLASQEVPLRSLCCTVCNRSIALEYND